MCKKSSDTVRREIVPSKYREMQGSSMKQTCFGCHEIKRQPNYNPEIKFTPKWKTLRTINIFGKEF